MICLIRSAEKGGPKRVWGLICGINQARDQTLVTGNAFVSENRPPAAAGLDQRARTPITRRHMRLMYIGLVQAIWPSSKTIRA